MYVQCSICKDFSNLTSFSHRRSKTHQKKLNQRLRQISFHVSQKKCAIFKVHDDQWEQKNLQRFCHFCASDYAEHKIEEEFTIESLGSLTHHASARHVESVKMFLREHERKDNYEKYCVKTDEMNSLLIKVQEAKQKYLKKMDILHQQLVIQIKQADEDRQNVCKKAFQSCFNAATESSMNQIQNLGEECKGIYSKDKSSMREGKAKIPPWLTTAKSNQDSVDLQILEPSIGPTADTFLEHVANQKKKGLPSKRIGANFKRIDQMSHSWLPSFHGVWNKGSRKQSRLQFNRRH